MGGLLPLLYFIRPNTSLLRITRTKLEIRPILQACASVVLTASAFLLAAFLFAKRKKYHYM